jgi:sugar lactone lactonase YvrE
MIDSGSLQVAANAHTEVGESPSWDARAGVLRFVDVHPGIVYRFDPADGSPPATGWASSTRAPARSS